MAATLSAFCHLSEDGNDDDVADAGVVDEEESLRSG